jgi:hypothetical protein
MMRFISFPMRYRTPIAVDGSGGRGRDERKSWSSSMVSIEHRIGYCKFVLRQHSQKSGFQRSGFLTSVHKATLFLGSKEGVSNLERSKRRDIGGDTASGSFDELLN